VYIYSTNLAISSFTTRKRARLSSDSAIQFAFSLMSEFEI
jgi:hypothetical protein